MHPAPPHNAPCTLHHATHRAPCTMHVFTHHAPRTFSSRTLRHDHTSGSSCSHPDVALVPFLACGFSVAGSSLGSRFTGWPARHIPYPQATRASRHCWWREAFPQRLSFTLPSTALPKLFRPPPFLASSIQPSVQPSFTCQTTGFSGQHSPSWPPHLCFMLGHRHPRHQEVPFRVSLGRIQSQVQEDRRR